MPFDELSSDALAECLSDQANDDPQEALRFCMQEAVAWGWGNDRLVNLKERLQAAPPAKVIQLSHTLRLGEFLESIEEQEQHPLESGVHADDNTFSLVENYALDHPGCGVTEVAVYTMYCRHAHFPKTTASVSVKGIADRLNADWRTIKKAVGNLVSLGLLEPVKKTSSGAMIYKLPHRYRPKKSRK